MLTIVALLIGIVVGGAAAALGLRSLSGTRLRAAEETRRQLLADAERQVETRRREAEVEERERAVKLRAEIETEVQDRRVEIAKVEERVVRIEADVERKLVELERREQGAADRETHLKQLQDDVKSAKQQALDELERVSGMTNGEARRLLLERSEDLVRHELARNVRQLEEEARADARRRARALVADALQRVAASHTAETTVTVVELASDDMKGRIIGREGRNIRALEHLTGVDFIIDDTPHAVVLSSFDG
ncbi:MAG: Rnase Y domain-containing protein, partial [Gaiellaceae bacterium]